VASCSDPAEVLLSRLAEALAPSWQLGGTRSCCPGWTTSRTSAPWQRAADARGIGVRWAEIEIETCELPTAVRRAAHGPVRLVAVTGGSEHVARGPGVQHRRASAPRRRSRVVDGYAAAACGPLRIGELGADVLALDRVRLGWPASAARWCRRPVAAGRLPSCSLDPLATGPERLEVGAALLPAAGRLVASIDYLSTLDDEAPGRSGRTGWTRRCARSASTRAS